MLTFLPHRIRGIASIILYALNTIFLCTLLLFFAFLKLTIPIRRFTALLDKILMSIATLWVGINSLTTRLFSNIEWDIRGIEKLKKREWYLVLSNHQSWVDILTLQTALNRKIPMLKFFLKKQLIWVPFLGLAWWALDFPFMKRYSKKKLLEKPHLKGKDIESTRKACKKFKRTPVSIMNFVEGTRFSQFKNELQNIPFRNLLRPKAGGVTYVLEAMGDYLHSIIDVTIVYPDKIPSFWDYLSGRVKKIIIDFEVIPMKNLMPDNMSTSHYINDAELKKHICQWLNDLWIKKDRKIIQLNQETNV
jgi:1-acyl-sn-glycerol-3-phosphate acyltransferase